MQTFKVIQMDMGNKVLRSDIVKGKNKSEVEQWAAGQTKKVNGQVLPDEIGILQPDLFYIQVISMERN